MRKALSTIIVITLLLVTTSTSVTAEVSTESTGPAAWDHIVQVLAGDGFTVGLRSDGRVVWAGGTNKAEMQRISTWEKIRRIELVNSATIDIQYIVGYREDGSIAMTHQATSSYSKERIFTEEDLAGWNGVISLVFGEDSCLGLREDGTILIKTGDREIERIVSQWENVVQLYCAPYKGSSEPDHCFIGVCRDGTIVYTDWSYLADWWGLNEDWVDIQKIVTGLVPDITVKPYAIRFDGTLIGLPSHAYDGSGGSTGFYEPARENWHGITQLSYGEGDMYALTEDGRVLYYSVDTLVEMHELERAEEYLKPTTWTGVTQFFYSDSSGAFALLEDGTVRTALAEPALVKGLSEWTDICKIYPGFYALTEDGHVKHQNVEGLKGIYSSEAYKKAFELYTELDNWENVAELIFSGSWNREHTVGLKTDGTVVAAGDNSLGQCDFQTPQADWVTPEQNVSGTCGENLSWTFTEDGTLSVTGTGKMENYPLDNPPWSGLRDKIETIALSGAESIGQNAFHGCANLREVSMEGVISVGKHAFCDCTALERLELPETLQTIEKEAFLNCRSLTRLLLPTSVETIGRNAFSGCVLLTSAGPLGSGAAYEYGWTEQIPGSAFEGCTALSQISFPDTIREIGNYAFSCCQNLTELSLLENLEALGKGTFRGCVSLTHIAIPEGATAGESMFFGCENLRSAAPLGSDCDIEYPWTESIPEGVFAHSSLETVIFPETLQALDSEAFLRCTKLREVVLPESTVTFGYGVFRGCESLQRVLIPAATVELKGSYYRYETLLFEGCNALTSAGPLGSGCDLECGWTADDPWSVSFPEMQNCRGLKKVILPEGSTSVRGFNGCRNLTEISLPDSIIFIDGSAFADCVSLTEITLPDGIQFISTRAFAGCTGLKALTLPSQITEGIHEGAFTDCTSLEELSIPEGETTLREYTFEGCVNLKKLALPSSLETLYPEAIMDCTSLETILFAGSREHWEDLWEQVESRRLSHGSYRCTIPELIPDRIFWPDPVCAGE